MAFSAQKTTLSYLKLNICSAHFHLTRNWDSQTLLVLRNQALKSFKLTKSITKKWKLFKKKIKLSPLLFCQCLQASLFVYAILWLYYIYLWWFLFSAKKYQTNKKVKPKLSQKNQNYQFATPLFSCDGIFFNSWCCTLLPLLLYRFVN